MKDVMLSSTTTSQKGLTVSIVSHRHEIWLLPLLEQLALAQPNPIERVILTHNVPPAANWKRLNVRKDWPFELLEYTNEKPLGFGSNHNRAFFRQNSMYFAVLNPDLTHIPPSVLAVTVRPTHLDAITRCE